MVDLAKLNGLIVEQSKARKINMKRRIAARMNISVQALGKKLNGQTKIYTEDAEIFSDELNLGYEERVDIFLPLPSQ